MKYRTEENNDMVNSWLSVKMIRRRLTERSVNLTRDRHSVKML